MIISELFFGTDKDWGLRKAFLTEKPLLQIFWKYLSWSFWHILWTSCVRAVFDFCSKTSSWLSNVLTSVGTHGIKSDSRRCQTFLDLLTSDYLELLRDIRVFSWSNCCFLLIFFWMTFQTKNLLHLGNRALRFIVEQGSYTLMQCNSSSSMFSEFSEWKHALYWHFPNSQTQARNVTLIYFKQEWTIILHSLLLFEAQAYEQCWDDKVWKSFIVEVALALYKRNKTWVIRPLLTLCLIKRQG